MKIFKILNNNVAVVLDEQGEEKIVMGKGICFKKKAGEEIPAKTVDKVFSLAEGEVRSKFQALVQDIPWNIWFLERRSLQRQRCVWEKA